jgi:hypothetical protein
MNAGYIIATGIAAATLFFVLLWAFTSGSNDETPWVPAGLAASVVMLLTVGVRELVVRRSSGRSATPNERWEGSASDAQAHRPGGRTITRNAAALRSLQKLSSDADVGNLPEAHLSAFNACKEYMDGSEELIRGGEISRESRAAIRSGQERVRVLQKHHLLAWARTAAQLITQDAQLRVRLSDKLETALRGLNVIQSAQKHYPNEPELVESATAISEFMVSAKVAHWVELAERTAFRGHYRRAITRYRDALFCLAHAEIRDELRTETAERIGREIELLRARLRTSREAGEERPRESRKKPAGAEDDPHKMSQM